MTSSSYDKGFPVILLTVLIQKVMYSVFSTADLARLIFSYRVVA